ncbi:MAG: TonB-dependent receptor [Pseudohongiellaceae bacterium]
MLISNSVMRAKFAFRHFSKCTLFFITAFLSGQSLGQIGSDTTVVYPAAYFAQFEPVTVGDMLDRIPGISLALGENTNGSQNNETRGLGGSAQILIDGKRMAGKENEAASQLDRIPAEQVERIEIIRGSTAALDVSNSGQLINIVLLEQSLTDSLSVSGGLVGFAENRIEPAGSIAYSARSGRLSYLLSAELEPGFERLESREYSFLGDLSPNDIVTLEQEKDLTTLSINGNLIFDLSETDRIAFNALYREADPPVTLQRNITDLTVSPSVTYYESENIAADSDNWEIGGDFDHRFADGGSYKFLFIANELNNDSTRERYRGLLSTGTGAKNLFLDSATRTRERIMRTSYTFDPLSTMGMEVGVERAQTILDSRLKRGLDIPGQPNDSYGGLVPADLPLSDSSVEEIRLESFVISTWQPNPRHSLETTLLLELSEIRQTGDITNTRDFDFIRPKLDYRFDLNPQTQLRVSAERVVSQLNFADFVAATETRDDDQDVIGGNAELVQEESWQYNLNLEYRLPSDAGLLNANVYYYDIENVIGRIDVSTGPDRLQTVNGNAGDGKVLGLNVYGSVRLGFINLPQALVTGGVNVRDSAIDDPLIGFERRVVPYDRGNFRLGFRHDVVSRGLNYGFNYRDGIDGNRPFWDIDKVQFLASNSDLTVFAEKQGFNGLTFRAEWINALDYEKCTERRRYQGRLSQGVLQEVEYNCSTVGHQVRLNVRGTF